MQIGGLQIEALAINGRTWRPPSSPAGSQVVVSRVRLDHGTVALPVALGAERDKFTERRKLVLGKFRATRGRYLAASLSDLDPDILRRALQSQEQHIRVMSQELDQLKAQILHRDERSNELHQQLQQGLAERDQELAALREQLESVLKSTSWRAMAPLRRVFRRSPRLARLARRLAKVAWYTITLQLPERIRQYAGAAKARRFASE